LAQAGPSDPSAKAAGEAAPTTSPSSAFAPAAADELAPDPTTATLSKKQQKKDARRSEKAEKAVQRQQTVDANDPFASHYDDVPVEEIQFKAISDRA
jgi:aspartyl-tRNA synthetase